MVKMEDFCTSNPGCPEDALNPLGLGSGFRAADLGFGVYCRVLEYKV